VEGGSPHVSVRCHRVTKMHMLLQLVDWPAQPTGRCCVAYESMPALTPGTSTTTPTQTAADADTSSCHNQVPTSCVNLWLAEAKLARLPLGDRLSTAAARWSSSSSRSQRCSLLRLLLRLLVADAMCPMLFSLVYMSMVCTDH
jgi:hypothetical protein